MRTDYSIKNSISALISNFVTILVGFLSQAIFIRILGAEYLGLNGLFTNVLTMLSIFELGVGNAIVFNLYKPIAENNIEKIKSLMFFYKKSYNFIAIIIFIFGLILLPFLKIITGDITVNINIYIIYLLFLISTLTSYFMIYKRNLIIATQRNYIINIVHMLYLVLLNISQLIVLFLTKNYYLYLFIKIICQLVENIIITIIANKMFSYLKSKQIEPLDKETEKDIFDRVKALIFHKIGSIIINGTDNIIISSFLGIVQVGLYTNYNTIITSIKNLFSQIISSTTASIGNLLVTGNKEKIYDTFKKMRFLNFWIACFSSVCLLVLFQPFIKLWVGEKYLLSMFVVVILVFNYYQKMMRSTYGTFKDSAGIWKEDKYVPLVESILNIVFSIVLLKIFGLAGVFMGTIISGLVLWCYSYPKFVYKKLFDRSYWNYAKETIGYILLFIVIAFITYIVSTIFNMNSTIMQLIINLIVCLIIPNAILFILFRKTENFQYFISLLNKIINKILNRKHNLKENKPSQPISKIINNQNNNTILPSASVNKELNSLPNSDLEKSIIDITQLHTKDKKSLSEMIRSNNKYIKEINFDENYNFNIVDLILEETKTYNFKFNNDYFLRNGKYPKILSQSHEFIKYVIDKDFNNIAYIDITIIPEEELIKIINYTFKKIYYLQKNGSNITFNQSILNNNEINHNPYFQECLKYIKK